MKLRSIAVGIALMFLTLAIPAIAADVTAGTWKLNSAKSKYTPSNVQKYDTVTIEASGTDIHMTLDGTDAAGNAIHTEWTGKYDGKFYPVTGDPNTSERAYKKVTAHSFSVNGKNKDGKITTHARIVYSASGKVRTVTASGTGADGKKFSENAVYDKQ